MRFVHGSTRTEGPSAAGAICRKRPLYYRARARSFQFATIPRPFYLFPLSPLPTPDPVHLQIAGAPREYDVHFRSLAELPDLLERHGLDSETLILVSDETVWELYGETLEENLEEAGREVLAVRLPPGEPTKSAEHLSVIYDRALEWGIDRSTPVLALGGGVIGDLAGYAASSLLRGLPLIQLPTTLIGQADSAIGGKTAINHHTGKNLIGAFHQPVFVGADLKTLQSLPDREWTSGLAEVLKYAFIQDRELYDYLLTRWKEVRERSEEAVREIVPRSVRVKADIVERDVHESGIRSFLNFGHTFAHAVEKVSGYGAFTHGEAVLLGMVAGLYLSDLHHGDVPLSEGSELILRLPVPEPSEEIAFEELWEAMRRDKKVQDGTVRFVLIEEIGTPELSGAVTREEASEAWTYVRDRLTQQR